MCAASGATLVGPDNGLLSMAWEALGGAEAAAEITADDVVLQPLSKTFHGRDVFAPAAAHLANGLAAGTDGSRRRPRAELRVARARRADARAAGCSGAG